MDFIVFNAALQTPPWRRVNTATLPPSPKRRKISEDDETNVEIERATKNDSTSPGGPTSTFVSGKIEDIVIPSTPPEDSPAGTNTSLEKNKTNLSIDEEIDAWWESAISAVVESKTPVASPATPSSGNTKKWFNLKAPETSPSQVSKQPITPVKAILSPTWPPAPRQTPEPLRVPDSPPLFLDDEAEKDVFLNGDDDFEIVESKPHQAPEVVSNGVRNLSSSGLQVTPDKKTVAKQPSLAYSKSSVASPRSNTTPKRLSFEVTDNQPIADGWLSKTVSPHEKALSPSSKRKSKQLEKLSSKNDSSADLVDRWLKRYKALSPPAQRCVSVDQFADEQIRRWDKQKRDAWIHRREDAETFCFYFATCGEIQVSDSPYVSCFCDACLWPVLEASNFFSRLQEFVTARLSLDSAWGAFSSRIPMRTGDQCRSFYRALQSRSVVLEHEVAVCFRASDVAIAPSISLAWDSTTSLGIETRVESILKPPSNPTKAAPSPAAPKVSAPVIPSLFSSSKPPQALPKAASPLSKKSLASSRPRASAVQATLGSFISGIKTTPSRLEAVTVPHEIVSIPKQLPANMCRHVSGFELAPPETETELAGSAYFSCPIDEIPWREIEKRGPFQGVLMDPPWNEFTCARLVEFIKLSSTLMPLGLIFLWVEKEYLAKALKVLKRWQFEYVENMVWVQRQANNEIRKDFYPSYNRSKLTLLICRRGKGGLELRHQRNPDVWFEPVSGVKVDEGGCRVAKPEYVYHLIETLLPEAHYGEKKRVTGGFLEIWSPKNGRRKSWTSIYLEGNDAGDNVSISQQGLSQIEIVEEIFQSTQLAMDDLETNEMFAGEEKRSHAAPADQDDQDYDSEIWFG